MDDTFCKLQRNLVINGISQIGEDPAVDVWMADVSHYVFKIFNEGKDYEQCKFSEERFIILYLRKFGFLLGVDHSTLSFYRNFFIQIVTI